MFYGFALLLLIFNQLQLIVISGAVLFLALFLSVGLVARTLGFTRTFGGAMIAFGLGIGLLFPLLVAITYGYIDVSAGVMYIQSAGTTSIIWSGFTSLVNNPAAATGGIFLDIGYVIAGLTFIPILNIAIVDAFIVDFSSAIGERMSFQELFSSFI
jgi:hypothetical protein